MISRSLFRAMCKAQAKGEYHQTKKFVWGYKLISSLVPYYIVGRWPVKSEQPPPKSIDDWIPVCELDFNTYYEIQRKYFQKVGLK